MNSAKELLVGNTAPKKAVIEINVNKVDASKLNQITLNNKSANLETLLNSFEPANSNENFNDAM